jgi:tRNA U34 5-methylaminomethyl-2-thiouridine-forming methyltransferase MnmC
MNGPVEIFTTGDGSYSLRHVELDETYHSVHGARQESMHVFINNGLLHYISQNHPTTIDIFEVGFGTGLNAMLTASQVVASAIRYTSVESFPLDKAVWSQLAYGKDEKETSIFSALHEAEWNSSVVISPTFCLQKLNRTVQDVPAPPNSVDVIYFDAFAPNKQPEMWEIPVLLKMYEMLRPKGLLVTYCAKGQFKRDLKSLGFHVEPLPGPPGKKEMVRATKTI